VSGIFHLALAWPEYLLYRVAIAGYRDLGSGRFALLWADALLLVGIPAVFGTVLGGLYATRTERTGWDRVRRHLTPSRETSLLAAALGRTPAPRAWDNLFSERPNAYLRLCLTDDTWIGGRFADESYAGGFPHESDLYLEEAWEVDQDSGAFVGESGLGIPVYVPAGQIRWMEIEFEQDAEREEATGDV
jgi:hypothetical protein